MKHVHVLEHSNLPAELALIVSCLRSSNGQDCGDRIGTLCRKGIDWNTFTGLMEHHRVVSPVYRNLKQFAGGLVPQPVLDALDIRFRQNMQEVLKKTAELVRIVKGFEDVGIPLLPLKGPVLSQEVHGNIGSRHVGDLDIMVPPGRVPEAQRLLQQGGYQRTHPAFELTPRQERNCIQHNHHFGYFCQKHRIRVELHWRFGANPYLFPLTFETLWRDRRTIQLGGCTVATLSLDHTIQFLCAHGSNHAWFRLFWLNDVARLLITHDAVAWEELMLNSAQLGISRMVAEGVILSSRLLGSPLPEPVRRYAEKDKSVYLLLAKAFGLIKHSGGPSQRPFTSMYFYAKLHSFMLRKDMRYKLAFCLRLFGPANQGDWQRFPLPDILFPFYSLIRPFTWLFRWYVPATKVYREGPMGQRNNVVP